MIDSQIHLRLVRVLTVCLSALLAAVPVQRTHANNFSSLIQDARSQFRPVAQDDVQRAAVAVRQAMLAVEQILTKYPETERILKSHVLWDAQLEQLSGAVSSDTAFWKRVYLLEAQTKPGLGHGSFWQHRHAVRHLMDTIEAAQNPYLHSDFNRTLNSIASILSSGTSVISADQTDKLSQLLMTLGRQQQAARFIRAVRQDFSHPNFLVYLPQQVILAEPDRVVKRDFITDVELNGANVKGKGQLSARYRMSLVLDDARIVWRVDISGNTVSDSTSFQDGVTVWSHDNLSFRSKARVTVDVSGITVGPFSTQANLRTEITDISTPYGFFRDRRARRIVYGRQEHDRQQAQRSAIRNLNAAFRSELKSQIDPAVRSYHKNILLPLVCYDVYPQESVLLADSNAMHVRLRLTNDDQLSTAQPLRSFAQGNYMRLAVHQSAVNNTARALAERTEPLGATLRRLLSNSPDSPGTSDTPETPNADVLMTFAKDSPLKVSFDGGVITVQLSGAGFRRQQQHYSGMDILLQYRLATVNGKPRLIASQPPQVLPPLNSDGSRPKVGIRNISLRRILLNVLKRDVPSSISLKEVTPPSMLDSLGPVQVRQMKIENGWLALEFSRKNS